MAYHEKLKDPRWQKKRLEILSRDNFTCQSCFDTNSELHVHHIGYFGNPWDCPDNRLTTLCKHCHQYESDSIKKAEKNLLKNLKQQGFTSYSLNALANLFRTDRGWDNDSNINALKKVIEDEGVWNKIIEDYWSHIKSKIEK